MDISTRQARIGRPFPYSRARPEMKISSQLFDAYLCCPLQCWLHSRAETISGNIYAEWARAHKEAYYKNGLKHAFATIPETARATNPPISKTFTDSTWRLTTNIRLNTNDIEAHLQAVEKLSSEGGARTISSSLIVSNLLTSLLRFISCRSRSTHSCSPKPLDARSVSG